MSGCRPAVPAASAVGSELTRPSPTRGGPAVPATSAFGSELTRPSPTSRGPGSAGGQRLWRVGHARPPHEQGAVLLRFVSVPAVKRIHGGRPKSRGLPPAAFMGTGRWGKRRRFQKRGFPRVWTLEWVQAGSAGGQRRWLRIHAPKPHEQGAGVLRFGLDEATVRADGGRGEVKGGWGRRRAPDVRPYVLGICEGMEGRCAKGKGTGLWTLGAAHRPSRMPPTAKARPSVDLKT